jgi:hypothetical protein
MVAVGGLSFMASKIKYVELSKIEDEIKPLSNIKIRAGIIAEKDSLLAKYAASNEFGAEIKPKNGKFLAIPLNPEFKGKSPKDFPNKFFKFVPGKRDEDGKWKSAKLTAGEVEAFLLVKKIKIPERAFFRTALDNKKNQDKVYAIMRQYFVKIFQGKASAEDLCVAVGEMLVSCIKSNITSNISPPNSDLTKRLKGSNKTLIDSGDLLKHIGYEIEG